MASQIQIRRDSSANWNSINPILAQGEFGLEIDTGKIKCGDGITAWNSLDEKQLSTEDYTTAEKTKLDNLDNYTHPVNHSADIIVDGVTNKVFTAVEKTKLEDIDVGANKTIINNTLISTSTTEALSAAQGKALKDAADSQQAEVATQLDSKVGKIEGKGLSTNDYDNVEKTEVAKVKNKADKIYVDTTKDNLNSRIDNIIATPTTVSEQEIIDARQGGASLGANITSIKDELTAHKAETAAHGATSEATANTIVKRSATGEIEINRPFKVSEAMNITDKVAGAYTSEQTEISNIKVDYNYKCLLFIWLGVSSALYTDGVYIIRRNAGTTNFAITPIVEVSDVSVSVDEDFKINVANTSGGNRSIKFTLIGLGD